MAEVEETIKRITSHKGVVGIIVFTGDGIAVRSTLDNPTTVLYTGQFHGLVNMTRRCVREVDVQDELVFLRLRTKKHEVMVCPEKEYMLLVIQEQSS